MEEWQTDPQGGEEKEGEEGKKGKISVLPSSWSSVMMLLFRFSQEFSQYSR